MVQTRVKICGITNVDDALAAVSFGADALGFVFYEKSPRYVTPLKVQRILSLLPPFVTTVGLFVNEPVDRVHRIMSMTRLQVAQFHGDEKPQDCQLDGFPVIKAFQVRDEASLEGVEDYAVAAVLLDAWSGKQYGGSGRSFDWQLAKKLTGTKPLILAGGLTPENVAEAVRLVQPYAVDVSSGVEDSPGRKNHQKITQFISQVKQP